MLAGWPNTPDSETWDRQMEADFFEGGAAMALLAEWDAEIENGALVSLDEILEKRE